MAREARALVLGSRFLVSPTEPSTTTRHEEEAMMEVGSSDEEVGSTEDSDWRERAARAWREQCFWSKQSGCQGISLSVMSLSDPPKTLLPAASCLLLRPLRLAAGRTIARGGRAGRSRPAVAAQPDASCCERRSCSSRAA